MRVLPRLWLPVERLWHDLRHGARVFARNPGLTAIAMLVAPCMTLMFHLYAGEMLERSCREYEAEGRIYTVLEQVFSAMPAVKAFGREPRNEQLLREITDQTLKVALFALSAQL